MLHVHTAVTSRLAWFYCSVAYFSSSYSHRSSSCFSPMILWPINPSRLLLSYHFIHFDSECDMTSAGWPVHHWLLYALLYFILMCSFPHLLIHNLSHSITDHHLMLTSSCYLTPKEKEIVWNKVKLGHIGKSVDLWVHWYWYLKNWLVPLILPSITWA